MPQLAGRPDDGVRRQAGQVGDPQGRGRRRRPGHKEMRGRRLQGAPQVNNLENQLWNGYDGGIETGSGEIVEFTEVPSDGGLYKVGDAGVPVIPARYDFLDLLRQGLGKVDGVISILPLGHSKTIQPAPVNKPYFLTTFEYF